MAKSSWRNLYQVGYRAERKCAERLKKAGYLVVTSRSSKGIFDVVGIGPKKIKLIQVKTCPKGKVPLYPPQKRKILSVPVPQNASKEVWVWEFEVGWHIWAIEETDVYKEKKGEK